MVLSVVASILCVMFAPTAAGPGIPEIKAYLNRVDTLNMFGAPQLVVKVNSPLPSLIPVFIIGSICDVSAGLDLGKERPLVHIGSCFASLLGQGGPDKHHLKWCWLRYFNNDRDRKDHVEQLQVYMLLSAH
ncbi:hypothetical protein IFM89_023318, partial [Coptis chinensis]